MPPSERLVPILRHAQFDGPGLDGRTYDVFVRSLLTEESRSYNLTDLGRVQSANCVTSIPEYEGINRIFVSTFDRTYQTAVEIASGIQGLTGRDVPIVRTALLDTIWMPPDTLSEDEYRSLEDSGVPTAVADEMFSRWAAGRQGETPDRVQLRIESLLENLANMMEYDESVRPAIVTHSSFASALLRYTSKENLIAPRTLTQILRPTGRFMLALLNRSKFPTFELAEAEPRYFAA